MWGGGTNTSEAAILIQKNLIAGVPKKSSIIAISFQHPTRTLVQPVLRLVIDNYFRKHIQIHRATGVFDEFLTQQTDELRSRLAQTEQDLKSQDGHWSILSGRCQEIGERSAGQNHAGSPDDRSRVSRPASGF